MAEIPPLTRAQVRRIDALAIEKYGIPGIVLMENAASAATAEALEMLRVARHFTPGIALKDAPLTAILCGGGNNGGDGFALARHLHNAGVRVAVYLVSDPAKLKGDAAINFAIVEKMNLKRVDVSDEEGLNAAEGGWSSADLIIDAILGTGFSGELKPHVARVIERVNAIGVLWRARRPVPVLAVDLPSGLDCDTGIPANPTIRADVTVTFVAPKIGFAWRTAQEYLGRVVVAGIGTPPEIVDEVLK